MFSIGYKDVFASLSDAAFAVIILKMDLSVEFMNDEANKRFGNHFYRKEWFRNFIDDDVYEKTVAGLRSGESVVLTPPHVRDFSMLAFQPIQGENGKMEFVRLNADIISDVNLDLDSISRADGLANYVRREVLSLFSSVKMASVAIRDSSENESMGEYLDILERNVDILNKYVSNFDLYHELMKKHNLNDATVFDTNKALSDIISKYDYVCFTNNISDGELIIFNRFLFDNYVSTIISNMKYVSSDGKVMVRARKENQRVIFDFDCSFDKMKLSGYKYARNSFMDFNVVRDMIMMEGGDLIVRELHDAVKISMVLRLYLRSNYSGAFKQEPVELINDELQRKNLLPKESL